MARRNCVSPARGARRSWACAFRSAGIDPFIPGSPRVFSGSFKHRLPPVELCAATYTVASVCWHRHCKCYAVFVTKCLQSQVTRKKNDSPASRRIRSIRRPAGSEPAEHPAPPAPPAPPGHPAHPKHPEHPEHPARRGDILSARSRPAGSRPGYRAPGQDPIPLAYLAVSANFSHARNTDKDELSGVQEPSHEGPVVIGNGPKETFVKLLRRTGTSGLRHGMCAPAAGGCRKDGVRRSGRVSRARGERMYPRTRARSLCRRALSRSTGPDRSRLLIIPRSR